MIPPRPLDVRRRHPLCPACGYDLVATVAADKRVCPECGYEFDLDELRYQSRPGDWSLATALRAAALALAIRTGLAALAWCLAAAAAVLVARAGGSFGLVPFAFSIIGGGAVGLILSRRLMDDAGFESILIIVAACIGAVAAVVLGQIVVDFVLPSPAPGGRIFPDAVALLLAWTIIVARLAHEFA